MFIGRALGWVFIFAAIVMASGEAVMALGTGTYTGLATSDVWALLGGQAPDFLNGNLTGDIWRFAAALIMSMPAWAVLGPIGVILAHVCRRRPPRGRLFHTT